jgi:transposase
MPRVRFTPDDIQSLRAQRFAHPDPAVQLKMEAVLLRSQRVPQEQILQVCDISRATLFRYLSQYRHGGVEALTHVREREPQGELHAHRTDLRAYFEAHPPATVAQACAKIKELTGLQRQPTQVRQFLHALGLAPRKVGTLPAKADVQAQEDFRKNACSRV